MVPGWTRLVFPKPTGNRDDATLLVPRIRRIVLDAVLRVARERVIANQTIRPEIGDADGDVERLRVLRD